MLHYLVAGRAAVPGRDIAPGILVASGEALVLEGPWLLAAPVVARLDDACLASVQMSVAGPCGFAVEALADPGRGEALVIGAHRVRDAQGFRPYAEQVTAVVAHFGGRFLARAGKVTPVGDALVSKRIVIIEFRSAADAVAFYVSDIYAPLMTIRHATTDPRFLIMARDGAIPAAARAAAESYLRSHPASSH